jgi:hypothetical protein
VEWKIHPLAPIFVFGISRVRTQGLAPTRQALYHLRHAPSSFALVVFWTGSPVMARRPGPRSACLCFLHSWDARRVPPCPLLLIEMGSPTLLLRLAGLLQAAICSWVLNSFHVVRAMLFVTSILSRYWGSFYGLVPAPWWRTVRGGERSVCLWEDVKLALVGWRALYTPVGYSLWPCSRLLCPGISG